MPDERVSGLQYTELYTIELWPLYALMVAQKTSTPCQLPIKNVSKFPRIFIQGHA